jgi:peptidyl-prolyl cis-trans isomerase SurA
MPLHVLVSSRKYRYVAVVASVLAGACLTAACRSTPAPSTPPVTADTWAVVDGKNISRDDVEKAYRRAQDTRQTLSDEETLTAKLNLLNELMTREILLTKAAQLKLDVAQANLDAAVAEARKNIPDDAFQQELTRRGLTPAEFREGLRRELLARKVIAQEVGAKIAVTDQDITEFFNVNRAQFNVAEESYHIAQIVVTPVREPQTPNRSGDDAATPQAAAAKIQNLMERLKAGASFQELAADYSEDAESAARGGDLGLVPMSRLKQAPPALRDAVVNKAPGSVTVVSAGGAHTIVLVLSHEPAGERDPSMPAVRERITQTIRGRREQLLQVAYLTGIRNDAHMVNYLARRLVESQGKPPDLRFPVPSSK